MTVLGIDGKRRCFGGQLGKEFYGQYHDEEWGKPEHDDNKLFEMLILEGAQAGLSWETILKRRRGYREAFHNFDVAKVAAMSYSELEALLLNRNIIRNRLKIYAARQNAQVFIQIQREWGSFDRYLWNWKGPEQSSTTFVAQTKESDALSQDLKKRGMTFVGSKIVYAYMQAIGLVNDHLPGCWCFKNSGDFS